MGSGARASPGSSSGGDRSPPPPPPPPPSDEALLHCVLEGKLRDREAELQQLRDGMEESEATVCQVRPKAVLGGVVEHPEAEGPLLKHCCWGGRGWRPSLTPPRFLA